jgi:hypothetical protein
VPAINCWEMAFSLGTRAKHECALVIAWRCKDSLIEQLVVLSVDRAQVSRWIFVTRLGDVRSVEF